MNNYFYYFSNRKIVLLLICLMVCTESLVAYKYVYGVWINDSHPAHAYGNTMRYVAFEQDQTMFSVFKLKGLKNDSRSFNARIIRFDLQKINKQQGEQGSEWFFNYDNDQQLIKLYVAYHTSFIKQPTFAYQGIYDHMNNTLCNPQKVTIQGKPYVLSSFKPLKKEQAKQLYESHQ